MATATILMERRYKPWLACETENRPTLTNVLVERGGAMVASNGYFLVTVPCDVQEPSADFKSVLIPGDFLRRVVSGNPARVKLIQIDVDGGNLTGHCDGYTMQATAFVGDKPFPNWRALMPKGPPPESSEAPVFSMTPDFLLRILAALGAGKQGAAALVRTGNAASDPIFVMPTLGDQRAVGLLMPVFTDHSAQRKRAADALAADWGAAA